MESIQKPIQIQNPIEQKPGIFNKVFSIFGFGETKQNKSNDQVPIANDRTMWVPDEKAQTCYNCKKEFSAIFLRKHHCRICGNVFCKECSSKTVEGKYWGSKKEIKVCDYCFRMYQKLDETLIETTIDNPNNLMDEISSINDNMKNFKRETKLSEYCKFAKRDFEECIKFLQMEKKLEEPIKLNLENYFDFLLKQIIDKVFKNEGINEKWVDKIFEITKKAIHQVNPSFRDLKDFLNINEYMKIKTICHKDNSLCKVIDGFAFQKNVCSKNMNTSIENPKILLLDCGLDYYRNNDITNFENSKLQEPAYFNIIMKKIELVEPNVILVNKNISRKIQEYLSHANKVSLVINVKSSSLKKIARCTKTYVLPSTDLIDKQTILGTCKKFRVEKIKFLQSNNNNSNNNHIPKVLGNNSIRNNNTEQRGEDFNKIKSEILNNPPNFIFDNLNNGNNNFLTNKKNVDIFNFQNMYGKNQLLEQLSINQSKINNYDNLKSNEYNLMIFEGCDNLLFCTIILYGPDKSELKKLKKSLRTILLTARDLFLQQHLLYFFYADIRNINEAFHYANNSMVNENLIQNNLNSINNNHTIIDLSLNSSQSSMPSHAKESLNNLQNNNNNLNQNYNNASNFINNNANPRSVLQASYISTQYDLNNNVNLTNIFCCLGKLEIEYMQLVKDFFFGFDRTLLEDKSKLSVVRLIITQGTYNNSNSAINDKCNGINNNNPQIFVEPNLFIENNIINNNYYNYSNENKQLVKLNNPNNELPEKEILESINSICDEPEELDLEYYSKDYDYDKPLGKLILDLCAESDCKCENCKKPKSSHFYYIYKKTGRLKIQLGQNQDDFAEKIMESINRETTDFNKINNYCKNDKEKSIYLNSNSNYNIDIYSYGVCKICKKVVTPLIKLTREVFNFSVAKFFKFILFNHEIKNRSDVRSKFNLKNHYIAENNCSHFLNKDIDRVFISKLGTIKFTYELTPLYIIETSPIHELKNKKHYTDILEEYLIDSKKKSLELIEILKNNFLQFIEELNSDFYKTVISLNMLGISCIMNASANISNSSQLNNQISMNINSNNNYNLINNEKKEIKDFAEKTLKICQKYYNNLLDINLFIELVYVPLKFKNYLKSVSIVKKIFFRIVQIKIIQDKCRMMIIRIRRFIINYLDGKIKKVNFSAINNIANNTNIINTNLINKDEPIDNNLGTMSPEHKSIFSSGIKENNNLNKDNYLQLNPNLVQNLNNTYNNTTLNLNSENNTFISTTPNILLKADNIPVNQIIGDCKSQINELNVQKSLLTNFEDNLITFINNNNNDLSKTSNLLTGCLNNFPNTSNPIKPSNNLKENISIIENSVNPETSSTIPIIDDDNVSKIHKPFNFINIETNDSYKSILRSIAFFDETNHKSFSTDISFNDIASIISYTLTSDRYRECISPSNRLKLLDIKCKRHKKNKEAKDGCIQSNPNGPIYNRINNISDNIEKNENKYGFSFLTSQDMEIYDTSLLFDQNKNNYSYQNLEKTKIYQQLETELLSDDKSQFDYSFTNSNFMNLLISLNMPVEYVNSNNSTSGNGFYKRSKTTSKSLLHNLNANLNVSNNIIKEKENNMNNNISALNNTNDLNISLINNKNNNQNPINNLNGTNSSSININNTLNPQITNLKDIDNANSMININNYINIIGNNNANLSNLIHSGNQYSSEERVFLPGDNIKCTIEELELMKKDLKEYKSLTNSNNEIKIRQKKKKLEAQDSNTQMDIDVSVYYPRQFEALRITYCATYNDFILSVKIQFFKFNL